MPTTVHPSPVTRPAPRIIEIDQDAAGQRIDNFLLRHMKGVPRSHLYRVLRRGEVRVNKGRIKPEYRLQTGDLVRIPPLRQPIGRGQVGLKPHGCAWIEQHVIYEDERLLVIDKPAGLAVHGGSGLSYGLIEVLRQARPRQDLELVHRLDRETSGCLLVSKRRSALRALHQQMRNNTIEKRYQALLVGRLARETLQIDAPLRKNVLQSGERIVRVDPTAGKAARTELHRLRVLADMTLVEVRLLTGRTHQIRVHAAHIGLPLAGDGKYGDAEHNRALRRLGLKRLFLHAASLTFTVGEEGGRRMMVEAPLPQELIGFLADLGGQHGP